MFAYGLTIKGKLILNALLNASVFLLLYQNIQKLLGLAPSRAATKQAGGFLGPPPQAGKFSWNKKNNFISLANENIFKIFRFYRKVCKNIWIPKISSNICVTYELNQVEQIGWLSVSRMERRYFHKDLKVWKNL